MKNTKADFWRNVHKTKTCWIWIGGIRVRNYGAMRFNGIQWLAHRLAWTLINGKIPKGLFVLHTCDNPPCVRPSHLFLGTQKDNVLDMETKGRGRHLGVQGIRHGMAKMTEDQVREIRSKCETGIPQNTVAKEFNISKMAVSRIVRRESWRYLT